MISLCAVVVPATAATARPAHRAATTAPRTAAPAGWGRGTGSELQRDWARVASAAAAKTPKPAPVAGNATVTADPSTDLLDGQTVAVTASGLKAKELYGIIDCTTGATDISNCDISTILDIEPADATGSISTSVTVNRFIAPEASGTQVDCATADACVLAVAPGDGTIAASTPLAFSDVAVVSPAVTADPSTGLLDQQTISVGATGFPGAATVAFVECPASTPVEDFESDCDPSTVSVDETDGSGDVSASYLVTRVI
ncbi:MAG: neocarzinostatin apoprotein domain-containing protein, partial [Acidimicrobiales bacterium]